MNPDLLVRLNQLSHGQWNDDVVNLLQFCIAGAAFALVTWGYWLQRTKRAALARVERNLLLALGLAGGLAYSNFGQFHFGDFIHTWDTYHYYMGAKYFSEVNYDLLYDCALVADAEDATSPTALHAVGERVITDLRTNVLVHAREVLRDPNACKRHFTEARWQQFKTDVRFFAGRVTTSRWVAMHKDHGFNATPVWTLTGRPLANTGPVTKTQVRLLWLIDPLYLAAMVLMLWWAFGLRVVAVALIMLGTNYPNRFYWTGGAYLRYDWLFYLVAVVCLLKKEKFTLAGAALACSALLRLFPGLMLVGPLAAGIEMYRLRGASDPAQPTPRLVDRVDPRCARFLAGGAAASVILLSLSLVFVGGVGTWQRFIQNTSKHAATPLTNHMGLRTVLSYRSADVGAKTHDEALMDPWSTWKERRLANWQQLEPIYWLAMITCCAAIYLAVRRGGGELWVSAALGAGMIAFASELTCYYYCFLIAMTPLCERRREVGVMLIGLAAATQMIALPGIAPRVEDVPYVEMSVLTLVVIAGIWWIFARRRTDAGDHAQCVSA